MMVHRPTQLEGNNAEDEFTTYHSLFLIAYVTQRCVKDIIRALITSTLL
jgi:hypothetical protein